MSTVLLDELYRLADANPEAGWGDACFDDWRERYAADIRTRYQKAVIAIDRSGIYGNLPGNQRFVADDMADQFARMIHEQRAFCWLPGTSWNWRRAVKDHYLAVRDSLC